VESCYVEHTLHKFSDGDDACGIVSRKDELILSDFASSSQRKHCQIQDGWSPVLLS
jgi:hypothetical protein